MPVKSAAGVEFLLTEIETGKTFVRLASQADSEEKVERNRNNARKAYDSVLKFMERVVLNQAERLRIEKGLQELKRNLNDLGETV